MSKISNTLLSIVILDLAVFGGSYYMYYQNLFSLGYILIMDYGMTIATGVLSVVYFMSEPRQKENPDDVFDTNRLQLDEEGLSGTTSHTLSEKSAVSHTPRPSIEVTDKDAEEFEKEIEEMQKDPKKPITMDSILSSLLIRNLKTSKVSIKLIPSKNAKVTVLGKQMGVSGEIEIGDSTKELQNQITDLRQKVEILSKKPTTNPSQTRRAIPNIEDDLDKGR